MKDKIQFTATHRTCKKLDKIKFRRKRFERPSFLKIEQWLYDKHKIRVDVTSHGAFPNNDFICNILINESILMQTVFEHPVKAKIEGIKTAIDYWYDRTRDE